jgi:hypothetical protein
MSAIESLMAGLIDYAGLYPPAAFDMRTAVRNYLEYGAGKNSFALGRFIVDMNRLEELRSVAGDSLSNFRLSVSASATASATEIDILFRRGLPIESIEIKCVEPLTICRISEKIPQAIEQYFEIPIQLGCSGAIDAIASVGARAKLRMGGLVADAFPSPEQVVKWLQLVTDRRIPFKATAGLHHPIRSRHPFSHAVNSPRGTMHGFINFFCAVALVRSGDLEFAHTVLEEEDRNAFHISPQSIAWRSHQFTCEQVRTIRQELFTSYGSCSFDEPLQDLEALGWL